MQAPGNMHVCMHMRNRGIYRVLFMMQAFIYLLAVTNGGRPSSAWKTIDYDALEKSWENDDSAEELKTEADYMQEEIRKRDAQYLDPRRSAEVENSNSPNGPQMMFATLRQSFPGTKKSDMVMLASKWKELLYNGGIEANIYEIEPKKVLVAFNRGWRSPDVKSFLLEQREIESLEWNQQVYASTLDEL